MKKDNKKLLYRYLRDIKVLLPISSKESKQFLKSFKEKIFLSIENKEWHDYNQLLEFFGTPSDIASSYLSELEFGEVLNQIKKRKIIIYVIYASITTVLLAFCIGIYNLNIKYNNLAEGILNLHMETTITEMPISESE